MVKRKNSEEDEGRESDASLRMQLDDANFKLQQRTDRLEKLERANSSLQSRLAFAEREANNTRFFQLVVALAPAYVNSAHELLMERAKQILFLVIEAERAPVAKQQ